MIADPPSPLPILKMNKKPNPRGFFFVIEGADGSGKTTLARQIKDWLEQIQVRPVVGLFQPCVPQIRSLISENKVEATGATLHPSAQTLLFIADRIQTTSTVIRPALEAGHLVVADRYRPSMEVYQGIMGKQEELIEAIDGVVGHIDCTPDLILFLDVLPSVSKQRAEARGKTPLDDKHLGNKITPNELYRQWYYREKARENIRIVMIDANQDQDVVLEKAKQAIMFDLTLKPMR